MHEEHPGLRGGERGSIRQTATTREKHDIRRGRDVRGKALIHRAKVVETLVGGYHARGIVVREIHSHLLEGGEPGDEEDDARALVLVRGGGIFVVGSVVFVVVRLRARTALALDVVNLADERGGEGRLRFVAVVGFPDEAADDDGAAESDIRGGPVRESDAASVVGHPRALAVGDAQTSAQRSSLRHGLVLVVGVP